METDDEGINLDSDGVSALRRCICKDRRSVRSGEAGRHAGTGHTQGRRKTNNMDSGGGRRI